VPWGLLADRKGYVRVLRIALLLATIAAFLRSVVQDYSGLLVGQFLLGLGLAAILPGLSVMVKDCARERLGFGTGVYVAGFAAGNATALGAIPLVLNVLEWREAFLLCACFSAVICLVWWLTSNSTGRVGVAFRLEHSGGLLRDGHVWLLLCLLAAAAGGFDTLANWMPRVLEMKLINPSLSFLLPVGFFLAGPVVGLAADRIPSRRNLVALLGLVATSSILGIMLAPLPLLLPSLVTAGFATMGVFVIGLTQPLEDARLSPYAGTVVGFISSLACVGSLAMPVLFGFLIDVTGMYHTSLASVAIIVGAAFIGGSRLMR